jgi:hypothetical protein
MARLEGTASFRIGGTTYRLVYNNDTFVEVENQLGGRSFLSVLKELSRGEPSIGAIRALLWAGLQNQHPDIELGQCGDWILAGEQDAIDAMTRAITASMPKAAEDGDKPAANPPKKAAGTGKKS